jgi:hypothetical protein
MAWNPTPEVAAARDFGNRFGADRVVIFYTLPDGRFGWASYGKTRALCAETRKIAEATEPAFIEAYVQKAGA